MGGMGDRHMPQDVLMDILSNLPVKTLLRCKCVCKDWYDLVHNPDFINMHFNHHNNKPRQLVNHNLSNISIRKPSIPSLKKTFLTLFPSEPIASFVHQVAEYPINHEWFDLLGPVNGIFLVKISDNGPNLSGLALWNPATRAFRTIPKSNLSYQPPNIRWKGRNVGFGWEISTNNYKVVTFQFPSPYYASTKEVKAEVYTLSTNSWKQIYVTSADLFSALSGIFFPTYHRADTFLPRASTYFNGLYYWLSRNSDFWNILHWKSLKIVLFDMKMEVFRVIRTPLFDPAMYSSMGRNMELTSYKDSLALIVPENSRSGVISVGIWLMESEGLWSEYIRLRPSLPLPAFTPIAFWGDGLSLIFQSNHKNLVIYNPQKDDANEVIVIENLSIYTTSHKIYNYKESLVPIICEGRNCICAEECTGATETFCIVNYIAQKLATICQLSSVFS